MAKIIATVDHDGFKAGEVIDEYTFHSAAVEQAETYNSRNMTEVCKVV